MKAGRLGILTVGLIFGLSACDLIPTPGSGPRINSFGANPPTITAGESSVLSWNVDAAATSVSISGAPAITGDSGSVTVTPTITTEYTLTARSAEGTSTRAVTVTVTSGNGGGNGSGGGGGSGGNTGDPASAPEGDFGVSTSATGTFTNDAGDEGPINSDADPRIISVADGGTFYAQVDYTDPDGIANVEVYIVNSTPPGLRGVVNETPRGGFTLTGQNTGECTTGTGVTTISCVYAINVAAGTPDIASLADAGDEFAYVFRVSVTDGLGNAVLGGERGYVNVQ